MRVREVGAHVQAVEPGTGFGRIKHLEAHILVVSNTVVEGTAEAAANNTLTVQIAQGYGIVHRLGTAGNRKVVLHDGSVLVKDGAYPVGALPQRIRVVKHGSVAGIELAFVHHDGIFRSVQDLRLSPGILEAIGEIIAHLGLALRAFLGGDEYHAVSGTGTVNGTGSSIFEYLDALDVVRVQVVDAACRQTIYNIKGLGVVDGTDTADTHLRTGIRSTGALDNGDAGGHTLQDVVYARLRSSFKVVRRNGGNSRGNH